MGANSANFRRHCDAMVKEHNPAMLVLLETMMVEHKRLMKSLYYDSCIQSIAEGLSGALVIM